MVNPLLKKATTLHNQGNITSAQKLYQQLLTKEPNNAHAIHFLGLIASESDQATARKNLEKSLRLQPNNAVFHHNIAGFLSRIGDIELATHHFKEAIRLKPDYAESYQGLTECSSFKDDSTLLSQIEAQLNSGNLTDLQINYMHFAAAKVEADSNNYDQAFKHYTLGNKFKHAKFDRQRYHQQIEQQLETFTAEFVKNRSEWGLYSHTPIFVLGMPRSGTTLIEQVLASHSSVFGAGELNDIPAISRAIVNKTATKSVYPECLKEISQIDLLGFGIQYLSQLSKISSNAKHVINKHPLNFKHIGFILMMFPNARIIHTVRDPLDTCLSCFFQNFTNGQEYSFNLESLGEFYTGYSHLMSHWKTLFPNKIYDVQYEDMIANQEQATRSLLQYCDLSWEDNCLTYHKTDRAVVTASKYQVRQPIYNSSIQRWKRYEKHLQPLIQKIGINSDV